MIEIAHTISCRTSRCADKVLLRNTPPLSPCRRSGRHLTPRAPIALPSCMARPRKSSDLSLLFVGNDALWGGGGPGDNGPCGALRETLEWRSLGQRAVAVESCLFVVQVLKAARRRTLGDVGSSYIPPQASHSLFFSVALYAVDGVCGEIGARRGPVLSSGLALFPV